MSISAQKDRPGMLGKGVRGDQDSLSSSSDTSVYLPPYEQNDYLLISKY